jgi:hypothetical protein
MRNNHAVLETGEIMVIGAQFFQSVEVTGPIEVAQMLFLLR